MRAGAGHWVWACLLVVSLWMPPAAVAQIFSPNSAPLLTLDQDRLYSETLFGKRLQEEFDAASDALVERNRAVSEALTVEEQALTEKRKEVSPDEFRVLADAFDEKVVTLRREQDAKIEALQRRRDLERRVFTGRILPILSELTEELGAVAILDDRAVILSAGSIDVTDRAIARIDEVLGSGEAQGPDATAPVEEAAPEETPDPAAQGETSTPPE